MGGAFPGKSFSFCSPNPPDGSGPSPFPKAFALMESQGAAFPEPGYLPSSSSRSNCLILRNRAEDIRRFRPLPVVAAERFEQVFPLEAVQRRGQRFLRQGLAVFGLAGACLPPCGKLSRADLQCAELDLAERQITVQRIVQLADVARPVVLHERLHDLAVEGGEIPDAGIGIEEVLDEQGDVLLALAQGGQVDRDDVDAVEEVLAHPVRPDCGWWRR